MLGACSVTSLSLSVAALAQEATGGSDSASSGPDAFGEILVTARKREESSLAVPEQINVLTGAEIQRRDIRSLDDLTRSIPQVIIGDNAASTQGGVIVIRGIGASDISGTVDQAVSFNVDGIQVGRSTIRRMAEMDMAQIEVLKGPQALFYGKNSPGGIISIHTADPTPDFQGKITVGYEPNADQVVSYGYLSGPVTPTLGARLALYGSRMSGWITDVLPDSNPYKPDRDHFPYDREFAGRLTLKFDPSPLIDAKLKASYSKLKTAGPVESNQFVYGPLGHPQSLSASYPNPDDCQADEKNSQAWSGPGFAALDPRYGDGDGFLDQDQYLGSLEINLHPSDQWTVTSVSGIYKFHVRFRDTYSGAGNPAYMLGSQVDIDSRDLDQEVRVTSNLPSWINFTAGAFYQRNDYRFQFSDVYQPTSPSFFDFANIHLATDHYSLFGQVRITLAPTLELDGGGRYSHETKKYAIAPGYIAVSPPADPERSWHDFSPEVTLSWRPTTKLTVFGSYRQGFLSGGFSGYGVVYDPQQTKGFEGGVKAQLFNDRVRLNLSAYDYKTDGLQISVPGSGVQVLIENAGKSTTKGVEFDATWNTPVTGLTLQAAAGYNRARYDVYSTACYKGQTVSQGCDLGLSTAGVYRLQDLSGRPLSHAPDWTANASVIYDTNLTDRLVLKLSGDGFYTNSYYGLIAEPPESKQDGYFLLDAGIRVADEPSGIEIGLIMKNLTDRHYFTSVSETLFTGSGTGTNGSSRVADLAGSISRGRQFLVQVSASF